MAQPTNAMQKVIDELVAFGAPPLASVEPRIARELPTATDAAVSVIEKSMMARASSPVIPEVSAVQHHLMDGPGGKLLLRIYRPKGDGPTPVIVYFHGGGWVIANLNVYDPSCRALCRETGATVVSVAYRQAPEHKFPAAPEDAIAAYAWVLKNASVFGGDPARVAVAGESAGGNLAAGVCLAARERGIPLPIHQILVYPVTDFTAKTESMKEFADAIPLGTPALEWFGKHYLNGDADKSNPIASIAKADLSGLPPATVITAEIDPLRDGAEMFAQQLADAGVDVVMKRYDGVTHEFFGMGAGIPEARAAVGLAAERLKNAFENGTMRQAA